jgi:CRAL/TRIO domain
MKGLGLKKKFRRKRFGSNRAEEVLFGHGDSSAFETKRRGEEHLEMFRTASLSSSSSSSSSLETETIPPETMSTTTTRSRWSLRTAKDRLPAPIRWRRRTRTKRPGEDGGATPNATSSVTIASTCTTGAASAIAMREEEDNDDLPARQQRRRRQQQQREFQIFEDERVLNTVDSGGEGAPSSLQRGGRNDASAIHILWNWLVSLVSESGSASSSSSSTQFHPANLLLADSFVVLLVLRFMPQLYLVAIALVLLLTGASLLYGLFKRIYRSAPVPTRRPGFSFSQNRGRNSDCASGRSTAVQRLCTSSQRPLPPFAILNRKADSDISQLTNDGDSSHSVEYPSPSTVPSSPGGDSTSSSTCDRTGASGTDASSSYDERTLQQISYMISQLSDEEQELAARTNYTYFCRRDESLRLPAVRHMCARYLRSKKQPDLALAKMKETLAFRKEMNVDHLRVALHSDNVAKCETAQKLKSHVEHKAVYVQGYDKEGRSTFIFEPHRVVEYCHEISLKHHVWTLERAIACSKHPEKTINAVINCGEFVAKHHAPPVNLAKDFFKALRSHYTGHVNKIFLVAPPRSVGFLWSVFKPFVSERTKNNVVFVTKSNQLAEFYCVSQAKPWMLQGGQLTEDFDVEEYIERPFDTAFT